MQSDSTNRAGQLWRVMSYRRSRVHEAVPDTTESESSPVYMRPKPRLFALLIGINLYDHVRPLHGAVPDIISVKNYLEGYLNVPRDQIQILLDKSASRRAIINAFKRLEEDERIKAGDPILVYFAGHGCEIPTSESGLGERMQAIVPQDYCGSPGKEVPAIPDRTIGALIAKIADKKGDNITLVFDCCHSGSGTRGEKRDKTWPSVNIRSVNVEASIHVEDLDCDIWDLGQRGTCAPSNLRGNLGSHMLIASCGSSESALEINGHGSFSNSFLKLLRSVPPDELRYADILMEMDAIPNQNPQCEGLNQKRYLFNSQVSMHARTCFNITTQNGNFVLDAGLVAGLSEEAEFAIHANSDRSFKKPLGTLIVDTLRPFSTDLKLPSGAPSFTLEQPSVALQTKIGQRKDLQLYVDDNIGACHDVLVKLLDRNHDLASINFVHEPEDADFELAMEDQNIIFLYRDKRVTQHGLTRLYEHVIPTPEELAPVLKSAAHFYWKLNRTNNNSDINNTVQVELHRLLPPKIHTFNDIDGGLVPIGPNLYEDGTMNVVADTDLNIPYGFKLTNNTPYDLYPYLFYFDLSDLSVVPYYEPPSTAKHYTLDVPLPKDGGVLTIGYGAGGASAQTFYLRTGQNLDIGFLKIFLCTEPVDLSTIAQSSPFEKTRSPEQLTKTKEEAWGTMLIPVLQHLPDPEPFQQIQQMLHAKEIEEENDALRQEIDILKYEDASEVDQFQDYIMASSSDAGQLREHVGTLKEELYKSQAQKHVDNLLATKPHKIVQLQGSDDSLPNKLLLETEQPSFRSWFWSLWPLGGRVLVPQTKKPTSKFQRKLRGFGSPKL